MTARNATIQSHATASHGALGGWVKRLGGRVKRIAAAYRDRQGAAALYRLSETDLKDIGVTRNDVDREVMAPIDWR